MLTPTTSAAPTARVTLGLKSRDKVFPKPGFFVSCHPFYAIKAAHCRLVKHSIWRARGWIPCSIDDGTIQ